VNWFDSYVLNAVEACRGEQRSPAKKFLMQRNLLFRITSLRANVVRPYRQNELEKSS